MPKDPNEMSPEMVAAQRAVFEQVMKAGEAYILALTRAIFLHATLDDYPTGELKSARKSFLDELQKTLVK